MKAVHPFDGFELRGSVDRIAVEVRLSQPTQFRHVQTRMDAAGLGVQYVHQIDPQAFRTTIQNPTGPDALMRAVQALAPPGSGPIGESDIRILEVEISLDAKPTTPAGRDQLVNAALHFAHHHANPPGNFRIVRKSGHVLGNTAPASQMLFQCALQTGDNTINAGWYADIVKGETWGDPFRLRVYVKTYDSAPQASYQVLLTTQHAARIEAILSGSLCPFTTLAEWRAFKFETMTKYFRQVRSTPASQIAALSMDWLASLGQPTDTDKQASHRRNSRRGTARDTDLNRRIYRALTRLTKRNNDSSFAGIRTPETSHNQAPPLGNGYTPGATLEYLIHQQLIACDSHTHNDPVRHPAPPSKGGATPTPATGPAVPQRGTDKANSVSYLIHSTLAPLHR